jgi:hypothetical protein
MFTLRGCLSEMRAKSAPVTMANEFSRIPKIFNTSFQTLLREARASPLAPDHLTRGASNCVLLQVLALARPSDRRKGLGPEDAPYFLIPQLGRCCALGRSGKGRRLKVES